MSTQRILAIANHKGGVGKTTTAVHLGAALAAAGRSVLLVDCDPQGSASRWLEPLAQLAADPTAPTPRLEHVFAGTATLANAIRPTTIDRLAFISASAELAVQDRLLAGKPAPAAILARALATSNLPYDFVLLDAPPQLGLLACNVLAASREILIPLTPDPLASGVLEEFFDSVATIRDWLNPSLRIAGLLLVRVRPTLRLFAQVTADLAVRFPGLLLPVQIRDTVRAAEAPNRPLSLLAPHLAAGFADDYRRLAELLLTDDPGFDSALSPLLSSRPTIAPSP